MNAIQPLYSDFIDASRKLAAEHPLDVHPCLELQQEPLAVQPAAEADQLAVGADHPVARHDDRQRVAVAGRADRLGAVGLADRPRDRAVAASSRRTGWRRSPATRPARSRCLCAPTAAGRSRSGRRRSTPPVGARPRPARPRPGRTPAPSTRLSRHDRRTPRARRRPSCHGHRQDLQSGDANPDPAPCFQSAEGRPTSSEVWPSRRRHRTVASGVAPATLGAPYGADQEGAA